MQRPPPLKVGDFVQATDPQNLDFLEGTIDTVEWSTTYGMHMYRISHDLRKKRPYWIHDDWVYSCNHRMIEKTEKRIRRPPAEPPLALPPPISRPE